MLEFIYYPVSFILWCWHQVFGFIFSYSSAIAWVLAIAFVTFTIRGIMFKPFVNQVRSMKKMQDFAPEMKKVKEKYSNDKQKQAQEMQRLQREHGVNPLGSCLPMLLQIPVFIGLNWTLRAFNVPPEGGDLSDKTENYFFGARGVESYLDAHIFGVNIGDAVHRMSTLGGEVQSDVSWDWSVGKIAFPLAIVAAIATHFTARHSAQRQSSAQGGQQKMMQNITQWVFPFGLLFIGAFVPVGLLIYFLSNNAWTLMQQRVIYRRIDREEEAKKAEEAEKRSELAPKPGQKPAPGQKPVPGQKPARAQSSGSGQRNQPKSGQQSGAKQGGQQGGKPRSSQGSDNGRGGSWAKGGGASKTSATPKSSEAQQTKQNGSGKGASSGKSGNKASSEGAAQAGTSGKNNGSGKGNGSGKQGGSNKNSNRKRR